MSTEIAQTSASLSNLLSGLIGAIIGGIISLVGSWYSSKIQIKSARALQQYKEEADFRRKMFNLLAEIKDNIDSSEQLTMGGPNAWIRFLNEMWHDAKGDLIKLPTVVQEKLRQTYAEINRYNWLVDNDLAKSGEGSLFHSELNNIGRKVKEMLTVSHKALNGYLNQT